MKVIIVANINSPHTRKWALALKERGLQVALFSINPLLSGTEKWFNKLDQVVYPQKKIRWLPTKYRKALSALKQLIKNFSPDLIHSHFLTNYTFLANLSKFKPHLATAWGSDVYLFPTKNVFNRWLLKYNLKNADALISTSYDMAEVMHRYTHRKVEIIPFGVDFSAYRFDLRKQLRLAGEMHIACFKKFGLIYGHDLLLETLAIISKQRNNIKFFLHLYGDGDYKANLEAQCDKLNITNQVIFHGWVAAGQVPSLHANVDVSVYLSRRESFGVSLIEAMASGVPLIVSPIPAFREVAGGPENVFFASTAEQAAVALNEIIDDRISVTKMTARAFDHAHDKYDLNQNITQQIALYQQLLGNN